MKAAVNTTYGPPEIIQIKEMPKPTPKSGEVLIKVHAATVNRTDCGFLRAKPFIVRFFSGMFKPKNVILGNEFAGQVEAVGASVTKLKVGDKVFGYSEPNFGTHAEYMVMPQNGPLATMPTHMTYEQAAPLTEGGHYALCDIRAAKIKAGDKVFVNGGTGAIGSAAIQIIKYLGAEVTATCATQHMDLVKKLGADTVIDYTQEDFTQTKIGENFDVVFDAVGKSSFGQCKPILKPKGIYMSTELGPGNENIYLALLTPIIGGKRMLFPIPTVSQEDIGYIRDMAEAGKFTPVIDRYYPLEEIVDAYNYVETGFKTGNVVIRV